MSRDEMRAALGDNYSDDLFNSIDLNGDGMVSFEEWTMPSGNEAASNSSDDAR